MSAKLINNANDFLGASETRYFSNGYKQVHYSCIQSTIDKGQLNGVMRIDINSGSLSSISHLGAIEYTAIACNVCEQLLRKEYNLMDHEIAASWIRCCFLKIKEPVDINKNKEVSVHGKIVDLKQSEMSINGYISKLEIRIGNAIVKIEVDHPVRLWFKLLFWESKGQNICNLHIDGYKQRIHQITDICLNTEKKTCDASVEIIEKKKNYQGIGAKYRTTLLADIINVSGQLSQVLLYTLEGITRKCANNMWLREFSINYLEPSETLYYPVKITFDRFDKIKIRNEDWRSVHLTSHLGEIQANFKITHKILTSK